MMGAGDAKQGEEGAQMWATLGLVAPAEAFSNLPSAPSHYLVRISALGEGS